MDIPFLVVRLYAIFGCGSHDYTSYFFAFKNIKALKFKTLFNSCSQLEGSVEKTLNYLL